MGGSQQPAVGPTKQCSKPRAQQYAGGKDWDPRRAAPSHGCHNSKHRDVEDAEDQRNDAHVFGDKGALVALEQLLQLVAGVAARKCRFPIGRGAEQVLNRGGVVGPAQRPHSTVASERAGCGNVENGNGRADRLLPAGGLRLRLRWSGGSLVDFKRMVQQRVLGKLDVVVHLRHHAPLQLSSPLEDVAGQLAVAPLLRLAVGAPHDG